MNYLLIFFTLAVHPLACFAIETFSTLADCEVRRTHLTQDADGRVVGFCAEVPASAVPQADHLDLTG